MVNMFSMGITINMKIMILGFISETCLNLKNKI